MAILGDGESHGRATSAYVMEDDRSKETRHIYSCTRLREINEKQRVVHRNEPDGEGERQRGSDTRGARTQKNSIEPGGTREDHRARGTPESAAFRLLITNLLRLFSRLHPIPQHFHPKVLKDMGVPGDRIIFCNIVACPEGIKRLNTEYVELCKCARKVKGPERWKAVHGACGGFARAHVKKRR